MTTRLGPVEIDCDAPPYEIVCSCEAAGLNSPLDVRWCRVSHLRGRAAEHPSLWSRACRMFGAAGRSEPRACSCGQRLPKLGRFRFVFLGQSAGEFVLGQCQRCKTVYWEPICTCQDDC